ncbi:hypothetical protein B0H19DRAFT_1090891 [Mycena capillaripes]|nr:hypothetical protein B0H19DRAFT_1090891 [Mycena capillaripes]
MFQPITPKRWTHVWNVPLRNNPAGAPPIEPQPTNDSIARTQTFSTTKVGRKTDEIATSPHPQFQKGFSPQRTRREPHIACAKKTCTMSLTSFQRRWILWCNPQVWVTGVF